MDFSRPAQALHDQVRGLTPRPSAVTEVGGVRCKILSTQPEEGSGSNPPGTVLEAGKKGLLVACGQGALRILELQPDGKKPMRAADYLLGHPMKAGDSL